MSKELFDEVYAFLGRFIIYPSEAAHVANTLWVAHAHLMDEWYITPRLAVLSPERETGKTRVLEITSLLVPRPINTENASAPALFRSVSSKDGRPTIFYDEIDTVFGPKVKKDVEDLRGLFNSGYKRGATTLRCEGNSFEPKRFPTFCAVALSGIGTIPDTVLSRSVIVRMRRRKKGERVEEYRSRVHDPEGHTLRDRIDAWAETQKGKIGILVPDMPNGVEDRDREVWESLVALADTVGGNWPKRARDAAVTLVTAFREKGDGSLGVQLLADLKAIFGTKDALATSVLIDELCALEESPWLTVVNKYEKITPLYLSKSLKEYGIEPEQFRFDDEGKTVQKRGYRRSSFLDAWERYVTSPVPSVNPSHLSHGDVSSSVPKPVTPVADNDNQKRPGTWMGMTREQNLAAAERRRLEWARKEAERAKHKEEDEFFRKLGVNF